MACTPTLTLISPKPVFDAGQEFRIAGKITFESGDTYPAGGVDISGLWKQKLIKTRNTYPHTIEGSAYDSGGAALYTVWHDATNKKLIMGGDSGVLSGTTLTDTTINVTAWVNKV